MIFETASPTRAILFKWCVRLFAASAAVFSLALIAGAFLRPIWKTSDWQPVLLPLKSDSVQSVPDPEAATSRLFAMSPAERNTGHRRGGSLPSKSFLRTAFVVSDDESSVADYLAHAGDLDLVFPTFFGVSTADGKLNRTAPSEINRASFDPKHLVLPVIADTDAEGNWHPWELALLLDNPKAGDALIQRLLAEVKQMGADGINVDFEQLHEVERDNLSFWLKHLGEAFHAEHLLVVVDVPLRDPAFDYEYIGNVADLVIAMAYDEHYPSGDPGSVAGQSWFEGGVDEIAERVPAAKMLVAMGAYGYDWNKTRKTPAQSLTFKEAMQLARDSKAPVNADGGVMNPHFIYRDTENAEHEVWFMDAVTAWNECNVIKNHQLRGYSLWRMGQEDEGLWRFLSKPDASATSVDDLKTVEKSRVVEHHGEGEIFRVKSMPRQGQRTLTTRGAQILTSSYAVLPEYAEVEKFGHASNRSIALTFDDGPDPTWTPQILEVLKENHVPGTFFVVGEAVQKEPALVRQELAEGHVLGNHTFSHPHLKHLSALRVRTELNSTERAIESATGSGTRLFRPPFDTDTTLRSVDALAPLAEAAKMDYLVVGGDIDASDYQRPGVAVIVDNVLRELTEDGPNIVVMHDGGGDRSQTVQALRTLIPSLKQRGYRFVSVAQLLHAGADDVMPEPSEPERAIVIGNGFLGWLRTSGWRILSAIFIITTAVSIFRIVAVGILAWRRKPLSIDPSLVSKMRVTVLIPAHNEAQVIRRTLEGVLHSKHPVHEIIVVDDGSTDETPGIVLDYARSHPQVRLLTQAQSGKWAALNAGFTAASTEIVVTIDADTIVTPSTLPSLIAPLADAGVDAVCGNVQVGNVHNLLTRLESVEYITMQNFDRRAFSTLNCISVVPGATGAWRRASVLRVGGYSRDTLTEDADLTITMLAEGYRIVDAPEAKSITEAPDHLGALFRQRVRWCLGTFQCLWKHRRHFFQGFLGWVGLPNLFLFQVLYPLLSPLGDIVLLISLISGHVSVIAEWYLLFLVLDLAGSAMAFCFERKPWAALWVVLIQRFFYRQFLYIVALRVCARIIKGTRQSWNKLERRNSVTLSPEHLTSIKDSRAAAL